MKAAIRFILVLSVLGGATAGSAEFIADYWGFSDEAMIDTEIIQMGFVTEVFAPLTYDPVNFQYTYALDGVQLDQVIPMGPSTLYLYLGGFFSIYEDASFNAVYDDGACTVSDPSTFADGSLYLQAQVDTLTWIVNSFTGRGSYDAVMLYVGGSNIDEIPLSERGGTLFGGTTDQTATACIPSGYLHRWDGQAFTLQIPTPVGTSTWGSVKALYH